VTGEPRRIKPEEVRAAYLKMGWKPKQNVWQSVHDKCGCALGVLMAAEGKFLEPEPEMDVDDDFDETEYRREAVADAFGVTTDYVAEFAVGFDWFGSPPPATLLEENPEFANGYACWQAVRDLAESEASK